MQTPALLTVLFNGCGKDFASMKLRDGMSDYWNRPAAGRDHLLTIEIRTFPMQSTGMFRADPTIREHPSATMQESL
jgi:hypothetical protein